MADDIVQIIENARVDATSLSEFIYYPANTMVQRRLAPSIHTLNYYLDYLQGLELIYNQPTGTVTVNGEEIKTVRQAINDSIDSILIGEYQTALEDRVTTNETNIATNSDSISTLDTNLNTVESTVDSLGVIDGKLPSSSVSISDGRTQDELNSEIILELAKPKTDASIEVTQKLGSLPQTLKDFNKYSPLVTQFVTSDDIDMTEGLRAYHNYCNLYNIPASYLGLTQIKVQANAQIVVNTDLDFCGTSIYLLNGLNNHPEGGALPAAQQNKTYVIYDENTPEVTVSGSMDSASKNNGSLKPTKGLFDGQGFASITDNDVWVSNRDANGHTAYKQVFHVIHEGQCTQPLSRTLVGNLVTVVYRKDSSRGYLDIKNVNLVAESNWNHQILLWVKRNRVTVNGFTINNVSTVSGTNVSSLIKVENSSLFSLKNVTTRGVEYSVSGTYVLNINGGADITLNNIKAATGWGWIGTNNTNGIYASNCSVGRIDGHESIHNVFTLNCSFYDRGVTVGWGGGVIMMTNTTLNTSFAYYGRSDYGSAFYGDIIINGVTVVTSSGESRPVVSSIWTGNPELTLQPFRNLSVLNVTITEADDITKREFWVVDIRPANTTSLVYAPYAISIKNIQASSNMSIKSRIDYGGMRSTGRQTLSIKDISGKDFNLTVTTNSTVNIASAKVQLNTLIEGVSTLLGTTITSTYPFLSLSVSKINPLKELTVPSAVTHGISSAIRISDSNIFNFDGGTKKIGNTSLDFVHYTDIFNCTLNSNLDISGARALQGVIVRNAVTLPSGSTASTAFTGWLKA